MTIKLQTYDKYKNSGVEWLEEIPEHWEVKKFKFVLNLSKGLTITKQNLISEGVFCVNYGEIHSKFGFELDTSKHKLKCVTEEYLITDPNSLLNKGDFIFADTSEDIEGSGNFTHLRSNDKTFAGYHTVIARPKVEINSLFFAFLFDSISFRNQIRKIVKGVKVYSITQSVLKETNVWIPQIKEQTAIAHFLDDKTAKIDQAIAIKQKQIELLKERRQILIHKAVTRGLNDTVKLKDSGVEWIGEIPESWEVKRLKELCKAYGRIGFRGYTTSDLVYEGEGAITISPSNIKEEFMIFEKCSYLSWNKYIESPEIQIFEDDILMVKTGSTYGKIGIVKNLPQKATINPQLLVLKNIKINADYFYSILKTHIVQSQIETEVIGSTIPTISETKIMNIKVAIPQSIEIEKIVEKTNEINLKFATAISLKEQEIKKLKEYKMSLIDGVVTGKVKVF